MRIVTVVGARPQFVKMAPVSAALAGRHEEFVVHTGQHYDDAMSRSIFRELQIAEPDVNLGVGSGTHARQTAEAMVGIEAVLLERRPDAVLVYGDTNSTLAGALAAAKLGILVAHVEAGLRSFNRLMAEETNRVLVDRMSTKLFAPTRTAVRNLAREGITEGVHNVGDVMYDAARLHLPAAEARFAALAAAHSLASKCFLLATIHRAENTDQGDRLRAIVEGLARLEERVILPLHPRTAARLEEAGLRQRLEAAPLVSVVPPAGYLDMLALERHARVIVTDSGGVQKEGYFVGTPVVTVRPETEWPETVDARWNRLVPAEPEALLAAVRDSRPGEAITEYGDGDAARRVADLLADRT